MIRTLKKLEIEGNFLNLIRSIYEKLTANITQQNALRLKVRQDVCSHHYYSTFYWKF